MRLCYVDESGKAETLVKAERDQQPVIVIAGVSLPEDQLTEITREWLELKRRFYPDVASKLGGGWLDAILHDIKGANLRRGFRRTATRRQRKHALGLISGTLSIVERHDGNLIGRIWVKQLNQPNDDMSIHSSSLQFICSAFNTQLTEERGMVVVDSQTYQHNHRLAHSMFTQRFGKHPRNTGLVDMPVFGHSDNHAGLQIADLLSSAVLAPIACAVYAGGYASWNRHCDSGFLDIREEFGERLEALTFKIVNPRTAKPSRSVVVNDPIGKRGTHLMWSPGRVSSTKKAASRTMVVTTTTTTAKVVFRRRGRRSRRVDPKS
jgi:hypothetical protein